MAVSDMCSPTSSPTRVLDEVSGQLDLVYTIKEGDLYRVGKINVQIKGEYPHTLITTVLNRLSLKPGDIVDIREIRASERRLKACQLFEANPTSGKAPEDRLTARRARKTRMRTIRTSPTPTSRNRDASAAVSAVRVPTHRTSDTAN